jgi:hypothetical protein
VKRTFLTDAYGLIHSPIDIRLLFSLAPSSGVDLAEFAFGTVRVRAVANFKFGDLRLLKEENS